MIKGINHLTFLSITCKREVRSLHELIVGVHKVRCDQQATSHSGENSPVTSAANLTIKYVSRKSLFRYNNGCYESIILPKL